ncbi:MAG: PilZ domain-containing protein [Oceanospirillales bacterium]|nr:MAG: PilZ domain-containing protein [Oceanospirillales bacterium]
MEQDRRQFYRIDKWVALEFQLLDSSTEIIELPNPGMFKVSPHFMIHAELEQLNQNIDQLFEASTELSTEATEILKLLNRKIDIIAKSLSDNEEIGFNIRSDRVNLSEGGLSLNLPYPLTLGQLSMVRLIMPESDLGMRLLAEVKRCEPKDEQFEVGLEFQRMPEVCRTELARLIFRSQIEQHHAKKESLINGEVP